jgi:hypothetical protein
MTWEGGMNLILFPPHKTPPIFLRLTLHVYKSNTARTESNEAKKRNDQEFVKAQPSILG